MNENDLGSVAVKKRLLSLYESGAPQLFTQILVDYDAARQEITAESARIYDLRAAARMQILFADGFKKDAAIRFLKEAIRHLEDSGLPPGEAAVLYPDKSAPSQPRAGLTQLAAPAAQATHAVVNTEEASWESILTSLQSQQRRRDDPAPPPSVAPPAPARPRQPPAARSARESVSTFPTLERYGSRPGAEGKEGRMRRLLPALISSFYGP